MKNVYRSIAVLITVLLLSGFVRSDNDIYFQMSKSIDLFGRIYKEVALNYVDNVNPEEFMNAGIKGMLSALDPYTVYLGEDNYINYLKMRFFSLETSNFEIQFYSNEYTTKSN